jgi:hypothetical protein
VRQLHDNNTHCQTTARETFVIATTKDVLHDEKTEWSDKVFPGRYEKDYLRRVPGRLQTNYERKTNGVSKKGPVK